MSENSKHSMGRVDLCAWALLALTACLGCSERPEPDRPNIVLISIDTLRWDRLGCTGHAEAATPVIDGLARRGTLYTNVVAPAPLTLPSHATMFTGLLPIEHGVRDNGTFKLGEEHDTLAASLSRMGYKTYAAIGAQPLAPGCGLERGFDRYDYQVEKSTAGSAMLGERAADRVTDAALELLNDHPEEAPFLLFVHYFDCHAPYAPPTPFRERFANRPYDGELAFVDQEIGRLLKTLERDRRLRNSLIVLTADHGEAFGDHGEESHAFFLYDSTIRVPLIVVGGESRKPEETQVRLQDLKPFLEARASSRPFDLTGPARRGEPALIESLYGALHCDFAQLRGLRSANGTKYLESGLDEYYDLASDPGERSNVALSRAEEVTAARSTLAGLLTRGSGTRAPLGQSEALPGYLSMAPAAERIRTLTLEENRLLSPPATMLESIAALQEGVRLHEAGLVDAAASLLDQASRDDPHNPALKFRLALALKSAALANNDREQMLASVAALQGTLRLRPALPGASELLIHSLAQVGRYLEALDVGTSLLAKPKPSPKSFEALGKLFHLQQGRFCDPDDPLDNSLYDFEKGIEMLEKAVRAGLDDPAILVYLDQCYAARKGG